MSRLFLGIDGGGTKTAFVLVDDAGHVRARHEEGPSYHIEIGFEAMRRLVHRGVAATLDHAGVSGGAVAFAYAGLPAYGEDSALLGEFDSLFEGHFPLARCRVGNDMVCSWAGSLACADGISVVAGTGSIAYGEFQGRRARSGGWGEQFGDEGSAYWIAREGLGLFSRMADGRAAPGPLVRLVREHFGLSQDLDLCAAINGSSIASRSQLAQLSRLLTEAARAGDSMVLALFGQAGAELAAMAAAVARNLQVAADQEVLVSYSGGVFGTGELLLGPMRSALKQQLPQARLTTPRFQPDLGAALYAAHLSGRPLEPAALAQLASS